MKSFNPLCVDATVLPHQVGDSQLNSRRRLILNQVCS
uniref:Uncharacterized protein n=1 Tax=Anguilla anguilla TaxID=7936 RepID=A0A0E9PD95_ANGAN